METRSALGTGCARLRVINTRREQGDFVASDANQYVFPQDCELEATRTPERSSFFQGVPPRHGLLEMKSDDPPRGRNPTRIAIQSGEPDFHQ
jgi:hypothetical protein